MTYEAHNPDMITALVDAVIAITGWGGIEFLIFVLLLIVMVILFKFVRYS